MTRPGLVSVIVPCFNQARFLSESLASLLAQTYPHWEAIVVDDGSTDDTGVEARRWLARDSRFRYLAQNNGGQSAARNCGLRHARGDYLQFLDADDIIAPEKFALQVGALESSTTPGLAICDYAFGTETDMSRALRRDSDCKPRFTTGRPIEDIASRWETGLSIPIHCFLFDARLFCEHGIKFDESLPNHEDWDCWMRIFALDPRIELVPQELAVYRQYPGTVSRNIGRMRRAFRAAVDAQLLLCQNDPGLRNRLERKRAEMDASYALRAWVLRLRLGGLVALIPRPMKRALGRLVGTES